MTMPIERVSDWERRLERQDAFFSREIIDRPVACITLHKPDPNCPPPRARHHATLRERWMDTEFMVDQTVHRIRNTEYLGDSLPFAWPNLGPELFAAWFGTELEFTSESSWAIPCLENWERARTLQFSEENFYWKKTLEMTDALLEAGKGQFYVGITDIHCAADTIAAFRDPLKMNLDMIENPDHVHGMTKYLTQEVIRILDFFHDYLIPKGQAISSWPGIVSRRRWYIPSNDFSCMISPKMFRDFFFEELVEECRGLEASIYHLDGPDAIRHLDMLLEIEELDAIQWIYTSNKGRATDWLPLYKRIQAAGKGIQFTGVFPDEIPILKENLKPEGIWMNVVGVPDRDTAKAVLREVESWR